MNLVEEQALERRERILETVRQCIAKQGVLELTIRDLAESCRVSVPTLYRVFGRKEQLLVEAISSFFNSDVLGEKLESTGLHAAERVLAIIDLCTQTMIDMPEYNQQLFNLFLSSDFGAKLGWDMTESMHQNFREGLIEIREAGELQEWVDVNVLAERMAAQCVIATLEICGGDLSVEGFEAAFGYGAALLMVASSTGKTQAAFIERAKQSQEHARRQPNKRLGRVPGKIGP